MIGMRLVIVFLAGAFLCVTVAHSSEPLMQSVKGIESVAREYFHALHSRDYDRVLRLTTEEMGFSDPTAEGQEMVITNAGRDEFLEYMEKASAGLDASATIKDSFKTGKYVVLRVFYEGKLPGDAMGAPGQTLAFHNEGVTVLVVENNKVVQHIDYVDYETLFQQIGEQLTGK